MENLIQKTVLSVALLTGLSGCNTKPETPSEPTPAPMVVKGPVKRDMPLNDPTIKKDLQQTADGLCKDNVEGARDAGIQLKARFETKINGLRIRPSRTYSYQCDGDKAVQQDKTPASGHQK